MSGPDDSASETIDEPVPEGARLTPRAALVDLLSIVGERAWSKAVREGAGPDLPGDLTPAEVRTLVAWLRRPVAVDSVDAKRPATKTPRTLADELMLIRWYLHENPTRTPGKRTGRPSRRAFNGAMRGALQKLQNLASGATAKPQKAPRALALLLLLRGLDASDVLLKQSAPEQTKTGHERIAWLVERLGDFVEDREGSGAARRANAARRMKAIPR